MSNPIRAGVIGFGLAGRIFHCAVISAVPGLELAGIVQRSGDSAAKAYPRTHIFRSADEMLADEGIRLVVVATPNDSHFELGKQALEAGRDVVIDKPLTLTSAGAADLVGIAREKKRLLAAYQNRRYDGDFLTIRKLLGDGTLGRIVSFESHFDRWRPQPRLDAWRENGGLGGGTLYDLGSHLIDQALNLFGDPEAVFADVRIERDGGRLDDAFDVCLYYRRLTVLLRATCLAATPAARFLLHGTLGSYTKTGLDPQEDALKRREQFGNSGGSPHWGPDWGPVWGKEPEDSWGTMTVGDAGAVTKTRLPTLPGDYRDYYANVRDAVNGIAALAVPAADAWRTLRVIELARESSERRTAIPCDFSNQP